MRFDAIRRSEAARGLAQRLLLAALALSLSGCALIDDSMTRLMMMTPEQEIAFGREVQSQVEEGLVFVSDPEIVDYVRRIGGIVVANSPQAALVPTEFFVIQNEEINAFAIPGGNIYVHTGLVYAAQDEAELAAVLAHEYGHVVHRHGAKHVSRAQGWGLLSQLLLSGESPQGAEIVSGMISQGVLQNYSRADELESDRIAIPTLYRANYDPAAMISFFETLTARYGDRSGIVTLFASHPATADRIDRAAEQIRLFPDKAELYRPVNNLRRIQGRLLDLGLAAP